MDIETLLARAIAARDELSAIVARQDAMLADIDETLAEIEVERAETARIIAEADAVWAEVSHA